MPIIVICENCLQEFEAARSTARFCGGTCRQQWNRKAKAAPEPEPGPDAEVRADVDAVTGAIDVLTGRRSLSDLDEDMVLSIREAIEALTEILLCENCGERPANGWESPEYCRRCEIEVFELVCGECDRRKPSVKSDDMLCAKCERGEG